MNEKPNGVLLQLPFPDPILNPNKHVSHWAKNAPRKAAREAAYYIALETGTKLDPEKEYLVTLLFCPPTHAHYDRDNLLASIKSALDGMCRGFGIDDRKIHPIPDLGPVVQHGKVEVTIVEFAPLDISA